MALSSQAISHTNSVGNASVNSSLIKNSPRRRNIKRLSNFDTNPTVKRQCVNVLSSKSYYSSSDEEANDSNDEQLCYKADQARAKRRASSRVSFCLNSELSKAVSKYSDESDDETDCNNRTMMNRNKFFKSSFSPNSSACVFSDDNEVIQELDPHNDKEEMNPKARKSIVDSDQGARSRCLDYLVTAIDEAWARYCDATSYAEDEVYGYSKAQSQSQSCYLKPRLSLASSSGGYPTTPVSVYSEDDDYRSDIPNTTDITDYEDSDFDHSANKISQEPSSVKLQELKDRLIKAKYYLQDFVDSDEADDCNLFWKRWDLIKYSTIELVEDDDEDEIVENTIEELEQGRYYGL